MDIENKNNTYHMLFHWNNFKLKLVYEGIIVGIVSSLIVVFYRFSLEKASDILKEVYKMIVINPYLLPVWIGILLLVAYIVGSLMKKEPMICGSGIPQVEGVLLHKLQMRWWSVILGKFLGGVLAIGSGLSLGREGPSVQLGAAVGQGYSKIFKRIKVEEKYLITCGASAGLSAAFNAPLAGVMFALEEVHKNFSPFVLLSALSAALTADYVSSGFFGLKPVLNFKSLSILPLKSYFFIVVLGIILGLLGVLFNGSILKAQNIYAKITWIPKEFLIVIPLLLSVVFGFLLPQVLGGGHEIIISLLTTSKYTIITLVVILVMKFLFTMVCFGSGAPGGIFLPLLAVGALIGSIYGGIVVQIFHLDGMFIRNFVILGMAGYFTAVVRAPITGIILITEMTGSFQHLLSLSIISIIAYLTADIIGSKPIYEALLERILAKQGVSRMKGNSRHKSILEYAVCMGSGLDGKEVKTVTWPSHCLLVAIKRGEQEIIPKGDTVITAGDYVIVLTNEDRVPKINDELLKLSTNGSN
ncbi:H(+)/Cl(-) exchange transporter ClcA [Anaeromicropila herbilytica]|uniref:Chloride ion channel protein n=1 Tax=Anaeromicropila herbilytica TaxID=2785025 RepID=A0A7R7ELU0_9FIRM|nr:H(+)/Cl(-) exchange transporter ClcA [Anaeromicropila herbilytica]BCN31152.1 chloride ion channel protein [Anaeromicropila herbilytica]